MKKNQFFNAARQAGLTLVELLVAMIVGLLVTLVALSTLILGRTGYTAVDSTTQLIDKERFAVDIVSKIILQAGYQDFAAPTLMTRALAVKLGKEPEPDLFGWNNAFYVQLSDLAISESKKIADGNRPAKCRSINDTSCKNGSDVLVVRFQGGGLTTTPDGNMVNCLGISEPGLETGDLNERSASIFYVARDANNAEPSLYCSYYKHSTGVWVAGQPLIEGVESMQLLFGTDNVAAGSVPGVAGDSIADRWLRADQLKVASNPNATRENWRRVRAVKVGLVLRGPAGSAQERVTATFAPLGAAYASGADAGSTLAVAADGRLRRAVNFTIHIRNDLSTR